MSSTSTIQKESSGFTLIETMLSLAIIMIVLGVVYTAYQTVQTVRHSTLKREQGAFAAMKSVNTLARDLSCGLTLNDSSPALILQEADPTSDMSSLSFYTTTPGTDPVSPLTWYTIEQVHYYVNTAVEPMGLIKETARMIGTNITTVITNVLLQDVVEFDVSAYFNGEWLSSWSSTVGTPWPEAMKILLHIPSVEEPYETEVYLPIGHVITSSLSRVSQGESEQ